MQRWIAVGLVLFALMTGGAYYGYKTYQANQPGPIWVPLAIRDDLPKSRRDEMCKQFVDMFADDARAHAIARDTRLAEHWRMSEEQAVAELRRRIFIRQGSTGPQLGNHASINIGVNGKQKDKPLTEKIVMRMMEDVKAEILPRKAEGGGFPASP